MNKIEKWERVKGIEPEYYISSFGRCRSTDRIIKVPHQIDRLIKGRMLECKAIATYPTYAFCLGKGKIKTIPIHTLLATHFLDNENKYNRVNHIDGNRMNYSLDNLEWCTQSENVRHAHSKTKYSIRKQAAEAVG